jgi:hypothetical protein
LSSFCLRCHKNVSQKLLLLWSENVLLSISKKNVSCLRYLN